MNGTALVTLENGRCVELPPAQNAGATALFERASRLPSWLPEGVQAQQFMVACAAEANSRALANCRPNSIVAAAFNAAVLGLTPGVTLGHCFFVPFKDQCQLVIGYRGLTELAYASGFLRDVQCEVVLDGEDYKRWNDAEHGAMLEHHLPLDRDEDWSRVQGAYCVWHSQVGGRGIATVGLRELAKLKKRGNVWGTHPVAMAKKTALHRASKAWKLTGRLGMAVILDDLAEVGKPQHALPGPDGQSLEAAEPVPSLDDFKGEPFGPDDPLVNQGAATEEAAPETTTATGELF